MHEASTNQSFALEMLSVAQENDRFCHSSRTQDFPRANFVFHSDENTDQSVPPHVEANETSGKPDLIQTVVDRIKQIKFAKQHVVLMILNLLLLLSFPVIHAICRRPSDPLVDSNERILVIKKGELHGGPGGEAVKNDAQKADLGFNDRIQSIIACQTNDFEGKVTLLSLSFVYSNGRSGESFGGINPPESPTCSDPFQLKSAELIEKVVVYEDYRRILNLWRLNKTTFLIVGISFQTNLGRQILFGSLEGVAKEEVPKNYYLAYVQGKAGGFIDSLRFIWYKICLKTASMADEIHA